MADYYTSQFSGEEIDAALRAAQIISGADTPAALREKLEIYGSNTALSPADPTTVTTALKYRCNPNLLDNWYFGRPVNQRGETSYSAYGYTIDRWRHTFDGSTTASVTDDGIKVSAGSISWNNFEEQLENLPANTTFTLSFLCKDTSAVNLIYCTRESDQISATSEKVDAQLVTLTFTISGATDKYSVGLQTVKDKDCTILAAKLELGDTQTLAHKEGDTWVLNEIPDFGEQLRRCQRYFYRLKSKTGNNYGIFAYGMAQTATQGRFVIALPVAMRAFPAISYSGAFLVSDGKTDYAVDTMSLQQSFDNGICLIAGTSGTSFTPGTCMRFGAFNDKTAYIDFSADL